MDDNLASAEVINSGDELAVDACRTAVVPRYTRRLSDKVLTAFHQACDQSDFEVAARLLSIAEFMLTKQRMNAGDNRRKNLESLVAAHERLWTLRHPIIPET